MQQKGNKEKERSKLDEMGETQSPKQYGDDLDSCFLDLQSIHVVSLSELREVGCSSERCWIAPQGCQLPPSSVLGASLYSHVLVCVEKCLWEVRMRSRVGEQERLLEC